ncbi:protein YfhM [Enterobacter cloacae]|uniref:Protein YfhM n=1 Tax=Enterobacter cloacae TaxID=550 RepID=A0A377LXF0_ENTCL|nr:protein YfhM [Enterobacter cloacae]
MADYGSALRDNALMLSLLEEYKLLPDAQNTLLNALSEQAFSQRCCLRRRVTRCSWPTFATNSVRSMAGGNLTPRVAH